MRLKPGLGVMLASCLALAAVALAQTPPADRPAKRLSGPDAALIKEAVNTVGEDAECNAEFTVGKDGKPKDIRPNCTAAAYDPYVVRIIETITYEPEIFAGEVFETEGMKQPFKFGKAKPAAGVAPVVLKNIEPKDIERAINRLDAAGACRVAYTVGADGTPKNIVPNCEPDKFNKPISEAVAKMRYQPGTRDGQAVDWPMEMPLTLSDPKKR